jgi:hypothetical protein
LPTGNEDANRDLITSSSRVGGEIATSLQKHLEMSCGDALAAFLVTALAPAKRQLIRVGVMAG